MKRLKFGEVVEISKREANKGIAWCLLYIAILAGFVHIAHRYWGWF